jgi:hypothetical protein
MDQATCEDTLSPAVRSLRAAIAARTAAGQLIHPGFAAAADVFMDAAVSIARIAAYGRITVLALEEYAKNKPDVVNDMLRNPTVKDIMERAVALIRKGDAEFLEYERPFISDRVLAQSCISMWSALEAGIEDMLLAVLRSDATLLASEDVRKIQIPLVEYNAMSEDERLEFLIARATEKQRGGKFGPGAGRFEGALNAFSLGGGLDDNLKKQLVAFSSVRNCLVHRRGVVDRRFANDCPSPVRSVGSRIVITFDECRRYELAALLYLTCVLARIDKRYGSVFHELDAFQVRLLSDLSKDPPG